jgi:hypothetical protein
MENNVTKTKQKLENKTDGQHVNKVGGTATKTEGKQNFTIMKVNLSSPPMIQARISSLLF